MTAWPTIVEMIRASKDAALGALLDRYQRKLFSGYSTCWVRGARRYIVRRAIACGVIAKEEADD